MSEVTDQDIAGASPAKSPFEGGVSATSAEEEIPNVSADEQAEYDRAADGLSDMLHQNEEMSTKITDGLLKEDPIGSTIQAATIVIQQLDERIDMDSAVIPQITSDTVEMLVELGEAKGLSFTGRQVQQVMGGTWEAVMIMFGGEDESINEDYATMTQGMGQAEIEDSMASYQQLTNEGDGAGELNNG